MIYTSSNSSKSIGSQAGSIQDELKEIECDVCGGIFVLKSIDIKADTQVVNNVRFWLTWFHCPACNHAYGINIEDEVSKSLLDNMLDIRSKIKMSIDKGRPVKESLEETLSRKLKAYRYRHKEIERKYNYLFDAMDKRKEKYNVG